eukprot:scaffold1.g5411.t1
MRLTGRVETGKSLDFQSDPKHGSLVAVSARFPPPRRHHHKQLPPPPGRPPGTAVLWGLAQPSEAAGINSAVSLSEGGGAATALALSMDGFVDLSKRTGLEWSLSSGPASRLSGNVELSGTLPRLPILGPITLRHSMALASPDAPLRHVAAVSARPFGGPGVVRLRVARQVAGDQLSLELSNQASSGKASRNGAPASGAKLQRANSGGSTNAEGSDSDGEDGGSGACKRAGLRIPAVRLELPPSSSSLSDLSWQWRQAWTARNSTQLAFRAASQQVSAEGKLQGPLGLAASGAVTLDSRSRELRRAAVRLQCRVPKGSGRLPQHVRLEATWAPAAGSGGAAAAAAAAESEPGFWGNWAGGTWQQRLRWRVGSRGGDAEQARGFLEVGVELRGPRRRALEAEYCLPF